MKLDYLIVLESKEILKYDRYMWKNIMSFRRYFVGSNWDKISNDSTASESVE